MLFVLGLALFVIAFGIGIGYGHPQIGRWNKWDRVAQVGILIGVLTMWGSICIFLWGLLP